MAATVASGALRFGQWPVAQLITNTAGCWDLTMDVLADRQRCNHVVREHCSTTSVGVSHTARQSLRLSDRNVTRANAAAISGSDAAEAVRELVSELGTFAVAMITGAIALDQPR